MSNVEIIRQIQEKYNEIDRVILIAYINNLIKIEYLRYHSDENYFNDNVGSLLLGNKTPINELDYAIEQAIFITLQPLRTDIDTANIEQLLLNWSGYILNRDINSGRYPQDIIHYFEDDEECNFMNMTKEEIKRRTEYNNMVSFEKKEHCTKLLCERIKHILAQQAKMNDKKFYISLAVINYRFIRIHPFEDGNGRVSRMLLNYIFNLRTGCIPIALNNDEINELIGIYKETSKFIYTAYMGGYLSSLEYADEFPGYLKMEESLTEKIGLFLYKKQTNSKAMLTSTEPVTKRTL